jgi:hypothetical protein
MTMQHRESAAQHIGLTAARVGSFLLKTVVEDVLRVYRSTAAAAVGTGVI